MSQNVNDIINMMNNNLNIIDNADDNEDIDNQNLSDLTIKFVTSVVCSGRQASLELQRFARDRIQPAPSLLRSEFAN